MKWWKMMPLRIVIFSLIGVMAMFGCSEESEDNGDSPTNPGTVSDLPADPGQGNFAGKVVGTVYGKALPSLTVTIGSRSTITAKDGTFRLDGVGSGNLSVIVSGSGIYRRTKMINTATDGRSVGIDAIETGGTFNLRFYRELARGNHPLEGDIFQTHRWTTQPTFYINTNAAAALDGVIDQTTINTVTRVLKEICPVFTGQVYTNVRVQTIYLPLKMSFSEIPDNGFVISFDDSLKNQGAYGITYTEPDFVSPFTSTVSKAALFLLDNERFYKTGNAANIAFEEIIAHESGHGFGFRHTSEISRGGIPSVMYKTNEYGGIFSVHDELHMFIVYHRPPGNTDVDNDPGYGSAKAISDSPQIFVDERATAPVDAETQQQLQALEGFSMTRDAVASEE